MMLLGIHVFMFDVIVANISILTVITNYDEVFGDQISFNEYPYQISSINRICSLANLFSTPSSYHVFVCQVLSWNKIPAIDIVVVVLCLKCINVWVRVDDTFC
jgi:hypothetical protein